MTTDEPVPYDKRSHCPLCGVLARDSQTSTSMIARHEQYTCENHHAWEYHITQLREPVYRTELRVLQ